MSTLTLRDATKKADIYYAAVCLQAIYATYIIPAIFTANFGNADRKEIVAALCNMPDIRRERTPERARLARKLFYNLQPRATRRISDDSIVRHFIQHLPQGMEILINAPDPDHPVLQMSYWEIYTRSLAIMQTPVDLTSSSA